MMRSDTVVERMKRALADKPSKYKLVLDVQVGNPRVTPDLDYEFVSSVTSSPDEIVSRLFDLSMQGHFIHKVSSFRWSGELEGGLEYAITLHLGCSRQLKTNIDCDVVNAVSRILQKTPKVV